MWCKQHDELHSPRISILKKNLTFEHLQSLNEEQAPKSCRGILIKTVKTDHFLIIIVAVIWMKYCQNSIKQQTINQFTWFEILVTQIRNHKWTIQRCFKCFLNSYTVCKIIDFVDVFESCDSLVNLKIKLWLTKIVVF